jgi:NADP-dependent 3-hydroxy acid dehydrogenase YdfG
MPGTVLAVKAAAGDRSAPGSRVEPGVVATELPNHITHADTRQGVQQLYDKAEDIAEIIAFILNRPRHLAINEILLRPAGQQ